MNTLNDYQKVAHESVDKLFTNVEELKQKGQFVKQEKKQLFQQKVAELEEKKETLLRKYNELKMASGQASDDMKDGFEQAKEVLSTSWKEAKEEFVS